MLVACVLDRVMAEEGWVRLVSLACSVGVLLVFAAKHIRPWMRRGFDWVEASAAIERRQKDFDQRLITVVSQFIARSEHRAAGEMLDQLAAEVADQMEDAALSDLVPVRPALLAWMVVGILLLAFAGLAMAPAVGLPRLLRRLVEPLAAVPAATTTGLSVKPGSVEMQEQRSLLISATVARLNDGAVVLHTSQNGQSWAMWPMAAVKGDVFTFMIPMLDRDVSYFVTAGDATSRTYLVHVLRVPAVAAFRMRYVYPAYMNRASTTVTNAEGTIEAPVGTQVLLQLKCTQPLREASVVVGEETVESTPTSDPAVREVNLLVKSDQRYDVRLTGMNGVNGIGPKTTLIHAIADRPPVVRLIKPAGDMVAGAGEVLPIEYEVGDDYGLVKLAARMQVNLDGPVLSDEVKLGGDDRQAAGVTDVDLMEAKAAPGDVISIWLEGQDTAGLTGRSELRHVLVTLSGIGEAAAAARGFTGCSTACGKAHG